MLHTQLLFALPLRCHFLFLSSNIWQRRRIVYAITMCTSTMVVVTFWFSKYYTTFYYATKGGCGGGSRSRARTARWSVVLAAVAAEVTVVVAAVMAARGGGGGARPFWDGRTTEYYDNPDNRTGNSATRTTWHRTVDGAVRCGTVWCGVPWKTIDADEDPAGLIVRLDPRCSVAHARVRRGHELLGVRRVPRVPVVALTDGSFARGSRRRRRRRRRRWPTGGAPYSRRPGRPYAVIILSIVICRPSLVPRHPALPWRYFGYWSTAPSTPYGFTYPTVLYEYCTILRK